MEGLNGYEGEAVMEAGQRARYAMDNKLAVRFYTKPKQNLFESNKQGRPIFEEKEYVRIMVPGDRNSVLDQPVKQEHRVRFASRYKMFKDNAKESIVGTPLEQWPQMSSDQVMELKYFGIVTVENLAEMDDIHGQKIRGFQELKRKATVFLEAAKGEAENNKLALELDKRDVEIAESAKEIEALKEQMQQILAATNKPAAKTPARKPAAKK